MKPDLGDAALDSLTHDMDRCVGMGCDHDTIQFSRHAAQIRKALDPFHRRGVGVDRIDLVTHVSQFAKDRVGCTGGATRHPGHSDSPTL
jgi:hypothetical protein